MRLVPAVSETTSHRITQTMTQSGYTTVLAQISTSNNPAISLATHILTATEDEGTFYVNATPHAVLSSFTKDTNLLSNSSLPSPSTSTSTSTSHEGQDMTHASFSLARTIIAVFVAIRVFPLFFSLSPSFPDLITYAQSYFLL